MGILITVLAAILIIGFAIWFAARTPDNLAGYYVTPVVIILVILAAFIIIQNFI